MTIWTIGHSTRTLAELIAALQAHGIAVLADVRAFPASRHHPQFSRAHLSAVLPRAGITYCWLGELLGGYRKKTRLDSPHTALRSAGFRNYADYMDTEEFGQGIHKLLKLAEKKRTAYMCAERLWWRCHRMLISDHLSALCSVEVIHILDEKKTEGHRLLRAARVADNRLVYDVGESEKLL
ncbi:MAG: DUF488 family protein [Terriglobia bacterium]